MNVAMNKDVIKNFVLMELDIMSENSGKSHEELIDLFKKDKEFAKHVVKKAVEISKAVVEELDK